jgi:hypothetical protein
MPLHGRKIKRPPAASIDPDLARRTSTHPTELENAKLKRLVANLSL